MITDEIKTRIQIAMNHIKGGGTTNGLAMLEALKDELDAETNGQDSYGTVCVDLDGVLAKYSGYQGPFQIGEPYPWAESFLEDLKKRGFKIVVFTTRGQVEVNDWLKSYRLDLLVDEVNTNSSLVANNPGKPVANFYIDDRSIRFRGDPVETMKEIDNFKDWWTKE